MKKITSKQREIYDAALNLFAEKGYDDTSMRDLAEVLGIKPSSIYTHIHSKEEILDFFCEELLERFETPLDKIYNSDLPIEDKVLQVVESHLTQVFHNTKHFNMFFLQIYLKTTELENYQFYRNRILEYERKLHTLFTEYLHFLGIHDERNVEMTVRFAIVTLTYTHKWFVTNDNGVKYVAPVFIDRFLHGVVGRP